MRLSATAFRAASRDAMPFPAPGPGRFVGNPRISTAHAAKYPRPIKDLHRSKGDLPA